MGFHLYEEREPKRLYQTVNWIVDIIAMIAFAYFTVYSFGSRMEVSGGSMNPALNSKDVVLIDRLSYDLGRPKRFDIAVFLRPEGGTNMKRIIGLPGETVQIIENRIYINGELLQTGEIPDIVTIAGVAEYPIELGDDEYFLLGDNRESSEDSRFATVGNVKREQLIGRVWFRFQPFSEMGLVQ